VVWSREYRSIGGDSALFFVGIEVQTPDTLPIHLKGEL